MLSSSAHIPSFQLFREKPKAGGRGCGLLSQKVLSVPDISTPLCSLKDGLGVSSAKRLFLKQPGALQRMAKRSLARMQSGQE